MFLFPVSIFVKFLIFFGQFLLKISHLILKFLVLGLIFFIVFSIVLITILLFFALTKCYFLSVFFQNLDKPALVVKFIPRIHEFEFRFSQSFFANESFNFKVLLYDFDNFPYFFLLQFYYLRWFFHNFEQFLLVVFIIIICFKRNLLISYQNFLLFVLVSLYILTFIDRNYLNLLTILQFHRIVPSSLFLIWLFFLFSARFIIINRLSSSLFLSIF